MSTLSLVAAFQHGFKIIPVIQGLISSQDKLESFARNLASVQEWVDTPWIVLRFVANLSPRLESCPLVYDD